MANQVNNNQETEQDINHLLKVRREKLKNFFRIGDSHRDVENACFDAVRLRQVQKLSSFTHDFLLNRRRDMYAHFRIINDMF